MSNCLICHLEVEEQLGTGLHGEAGVVCESCHGESRGHLDDEHNNVKPDRRFTGETVPALCAECHAAEAESYAASRALNAALPPCNACHGTHEIASLDAAAEACAELGVGSPHGGGGAGRAAVVTGRAGGAGWRLVGRAPGVGEGAVWRVVAEGAGGSDAEGALASELGCGAGRTVVAWGRTHGEIVVPMPAAASLRVERATVGGRAVPARWVGRCVLVKAGPPGAGVVVRLALAKPVVLGGSLR
jgi:hypothetical protein